jgi:hypothetical protein
MNRDYSNALTSMHGAIKNCHFIGARGGLYHDLASTQAHALMQAIPFFWNKETASAVFQASKSVPLDTCLTKWNLPTNAVWWYFEEPVFDSPTVDHGKTVLIPCRALSMYWSGPYFVVVPWADSVKFPGTMFPCGVMNWPEGRNLQHMAIDADSMAIDEGKVVLSDNLTVDEPPFILAALAWLEQRVLNTTAANVHRAVRREFQRVYDCKAEDVRIIHLRRAEHNSDAVKVEHDETEESRYSCRWVVDGHWRNQPCGRRHADRRLTWISPYLKGPNDAPLKEFQPKMYVVVR